MNKERVDNPSEGGSYVRHEDGTCTLMKRGKTEGLVVNHPEHERKAIEKAAAEEEKKTKHPHGHAPRGDK